MCIKKEIQLLLIMILLRFVVPASADEMDIDSVLKRIRLSQEVESNDDINLSNIDDQELQALGFAIINTSELTDDYQTFISDVRRLSKYDTIENIQKTAAIEYIRNGFKVTGLTTGDISESPDYHIALGEIILFIALVVFGIISILYKKILNKKTEID